jgi:hypothetical protein
MAEAGRPRESSSGHAQVREVKSSARATGALIRNASAMRLAKQRILVENFIVSPSFSGH